MKMIRYARINGDKLEYPKTSEFSNIRSVTPSDSLLRNHGYMPLVGVAEQREGYNAKPARWHVENLSETRKAYRKEFQDVYGTSPFGKRVVVGRKEVEVEDDVEVDKSYILIDEWSYEPMRQPSQAVVDDSEFKKACIMFRNVCAQIGEFIGDEEFRGGFEDYSKFIESSAAKQSKASASLLASMWNGANEYAQYEGEKIGYGRPEWWYKCWEYTEEELGGSQ